MSQQPTNPGQRYYPPNTPENRHIRFAFDQLYALHDEHEKTKSALATAQAQVKQLSTKLAGPYPPGAGPTDSVLLGVPVQPIDTNTLADATKLTFDKKNGVFVFK